MGNASSHTAPASWQQEDVIKWKERSIEQQKQYYNGYEGTQFHSINCAEEGNLDLLKAKICYALFGLPTEGIAGNLLSGYTEGCIKDATEFAKSICALYPEKHRATVEILTLFVCCKSDDGESTVPVFRIRVDTKTIKYMDTCKREYSSWQDWLDNNKLPMMKYCFPKHGYYSCSHSDRAEYNEDKYPAIEWGTTPACKPGAQYASMLDTSSMFASLGAGGLMIIGMVTPVAPVIMVGAAVGGMGSALWGAGRSAQRLADKKQHGESWNDLESIMSIVAISILPLSFATSAVNAYISNGARVSGQIFTSTIRTAATILNCTTLGVQSGMLALGLANLIQKAEKKQLTSLDVLQFSMTVFFFTNTVMQPKTANGIIAKAQTEHVQQYRDSMSDEHAMSTFDKYLKQNKGDGGIKDMSKVVRNINKIDNPDQLFSGLRNADNIAIGGRKGNTLLVSKEGTENMPTRISVNRTFVKSTPISAHQRVQLDSALRGHSKTEFGKRVLNLDTMEPHEASRLNRVIKNTCHREARIIDAAAALSEDLDVKNVGDFCAVLELVSREDGIGADLNHLTGAGRREFLAGIRSDTVRAGKIAAKADMRFESDLKAAYHYRKHGTEFITKGNPMDFYLESLPKKIFTTENLRNVETGGEIIREHYCTPDGDFGVLMKRAGTDKPIISTVFKNERIYKEYVAHVAETIERNNFVAPTPSYLNSLLSHLSGGTDPTEFLRFLHIE